MREFIRIAIGEEMKNKLKQNKVYYEDTLAFRIFIIYYIELLKNKTKIKQDGQAYLGKYAYADISCSKEIKLLHNDFVKEYGSRNLSKRRIYLTNCIANLALEREKDLTQEIRSKIEEF